MSIGILTSGGDCPGLNAVIRGAVLKGIATHGHEFVGFLDGWRGVEEGDIIDIPRTMVRGIAKQGGTILGTSRTNPFENGGGPEVIKAHMDRRLEVSIRKCPKITAPGGRPWPNRTVLTARGMVQAVARCSVRATAIVGGGWTAALLRRGGEIAAAD